jgi:hypothetical protein
VEHAIEVPAARTLHKLAHSVHLARRNGREDSISSASTMLRSSTP